MKQRGILMDWLTNWIWHLLTYPSQDAPSTFYFSFLHDPGRDVFRRQCIGMAWQESNENKESLQLYTPPSSSEAILMEDAVRKSEQRQGHCSSHNRQTPPTLFWLKWVTAMLPITTPAIFSPLLWLSFEVLHYRIISAFQQYLIYNFFKSSNHSSKCQILSVPPNTSTEICQDTPWPVPSITETGLP